MCAITASVPQGKETQAAASLGIGSTWIMHFIPEAVREEFQLPDTWEPVSFLALGYSAEDAKPYPSHNSIKPLAETVSFL